MELIKAFMVAGGPVVAIFLLFSVVAVTIIAIKVWPFWSVRGMGSMYIGQTLVHIESGDRAQALLTTNVGLAVIPASLFNSGLERFVENTAARISDDIGRIFIAYADHRSAANVRKGAAVHQA